MADGINQVVLAGNVGQDPQLKTFDTGGAVLTFRLATNDSYTDQSGARKEIVDWHTISINGAKRANALNDIIKKGMKVTVLGKVKTRMYEKDGEKRYVTEIRADKLVFGGAGGKAEGGDGTDFDPSTMGVTDDDQP